jgi:uncharacterized protein (DUF433 family)
MSSPTIDIGRLLESSADVLDGEVVIRGTRVTVESVVAAHLTHGIPLSELTDEDPRLSLAALYAALAFYHKHQEDFEHQHEEDLAWGASHVSAGSSGDIASPVRSASGR